MSATGTKVVAPATPPPSPFDQFIASADAFFKKEEAAVKSAFSGAIQAVEAGAQKVYVDFEKLLEIGAPIAFQEVVSQGPSVVSGNEKLSQAVANTYEALQASPALENEGQVLYQDCVVLVQSAVRRFQQLLGLAPTS